VKDTRNIEDILLNASQANRQDTIALINAIESLVKKNDNPVLDDTRSLIRRYGNYIKSVNSNGVDKSSERTLKAFDNLVKKLGQALREGGGSSYLSNSIAIQDKRELNKATRDFRLKEEIRKRLERDRIRKEEERSRLKGKRERQRFKAKVNRSVRVLGASVVNLSDTARLRYMEFKEEKKRFYEKFLKKWGDFTTDFKEKASETLSPYGRELGRAGLTAGAMALGGAIGGNVGASVAGIGALLANSPLGYFLAGSIGKAFTKVIGKINLKTLGALKGIGLRGAGALGWGGFQAYEAMKAGKEGNISKSVLSGLSGLGALAAVIPHPIAKAIGFSIIGISEILKIALPWLRGFFKGDEKRLKSLDSSSKYSMAPGSVMPIIDIRNKKVVSKAPYSNSKGFYNALGLRESGGNYSSVNSFGYLGKYQFGKGALQDVGLRNADGTWTGKFNVHSKEDYLGSKIAQEYAVRELARRNWSTMKLLGLDKYVGKTVNGIHITKSGMLAAAHLKGVGGVMDFLTKGKDSKDGYGTPMSEYMQRFSGYDDLFTAGDSTTRAKESLALAPTPTSPRPLPHVNYSNDPTGQKGFMDSVNSLNNGSGVFNQ
jgi:hypothetical protein